MPAALFYGLDMIMGGFQMGLLKFDGNSLMMNWIILAILRRCD
jgi:hypothetical protein